MARNAEAAAAALAYCEAAVVRLAELNVARWDDFQCDWTRQGDLFVRRVRTERATDLTSSRDVLHRLPEFGAAVEAFRADAQIANQLRWVGSVLGYGQIRVEDMVDDILRAGISPEDPLRVDEGAARQAYEEREGFFYADSVRHTFLAPLLGLEAEDLPIELAEGVEINAFGDEEIERCLSVGMLPYGDGPFVPIKRLDGLRVCLAVPKVIVPDSEPPPDDALEPASAIYQQLTAHLERVTQALPLLKAGAVGSRGYAYFSDDPWHGTGWWDPLNGGVRSYAIYRLASTENAQVRELWALLSADEVVNHMTLPSALRRFVHARELRPEDQLIDLMIAAEMLFLPGEEQDPAYKLALRSASFLADVGRPHDQTFAHMKQAYSASRAIVHGSRPETLESADGRQVRLGQFVQETSELVREALVKALRVVRDAGGDSLLDFDGPILEA